LIVVTLVGLAAAQGNAIPQAYIPLVMGGDQDIPPILETQLTVLPTSGQPGSLVHVQGVGFEDSPCGVNFYWDSLEGVFLAFSRVVEGQFMADLTIPEGAGQGDHVIIAQGLLFGGEFCGDFSEDQARVDFTVTDTMPLVTLEGGDTTPGSEIMIYGAHFCSSPECSSVSVYFGNALSTQDIQVEADGTFSAQVTVPGGYPIGLVPVTVSQTDAEGNELKAYGEIQIWTRPNFVEGPAPRQASEPATDVASASVIESILDGAPSAVTDVNPDGLPSAPYGGRVRGITISPNNNQLAYAASELGGIFRSTNGGTNWTHIDDVPLSISLDVMFNPQNANIVIASGFSDGGATNQGGIWRSTDGGFTWNKPATSTPTSATPGCNQQASTWGIAIPDDPALNTNVYVGTDCSLAISNDSGATWNHVDPCPTCGNGGRVYDVAARAVGGAVQLDVCTSEGYFRSTDGGTTWSAPDPADPIVAGLNGSPCYVATAPNDANTVYLAHFSMVNASGFCVSQLLESSTPLTSGSWVDMQVTDSNCRDAWVVTHPALDGNANHFEVYFGTSQKVRHQTCDIGNTPRCQTGAGNWPQVDSGAHPDPSDIAFDTSTANGCPVLLSTDGGISTSSDCGATWDDGNRGLHALDIRGLAGTVEAGHTDLYFGTQDNGLYFSQDGSASWTRPVGADVYNVLADHTSPARVYYRQCFGCSDRIADAHIVGAGGFSSPPGTVPTTAVADQFGPQSYIFLTNDGGNPAQWTAYVTTDEGATWNQMGPSPLPGNPGEVKAAGPTATPTFYMRLNVGGQLRLYQLSGALDSSASLTLASNGLLIPTRAWGVDPEDPDFLYASDVGAGQMMFSEDGGITWNPDPALTNLVTRGGDYLFWPNIGAMASNIAFDSNSDTIIVGTRTAGIFASVTNGEDWFSIPGAEGLPLFRDAFFDESDGSIYLATQGRGIWLVELPLANLSITKDSHPNPVNAGEQLWYDITVANAGPDGATDVLVVDTLPLGVTYQTDTDTCTLTPGTGPGGEDQLICELGDIPNGGSVSFTIQVLVDQDLVAAAGGPTTLTNTAEVTAGEQGDLDLSDNIAVETTIVNEVADLRVTKECKPDRPVAAGDEAVCTIWVENLGPSAARNVVVTDEHVSDGTFYFGTITPLSCVATGNPQVGAGTVTCGLGDMDAGEVVEIKVPEWSNEWIDLNDHVTVTSDTLDPDPSNNQDEDHVEVRPSADLAISKTDFPDPVVAGSQLTYTLTITNNGPSAAEDVRVEDILPAGVVIAKEIDTSPAGVCTPSVPGTAADRIVCVFGNLDSGDTATVTIVVTVDEDNPGPLHNSAQVFSDNHDPNMIDNFATTTTTVGDSADLAVTKTDTPDPVNAGDEVTYEVTITNNGPSDATDVALLDTLPPEVTFVGATISNGAGTCVLLIAPPNTVSCDLGTLSPGSFVTVFIVALVDPATPDGTVISNTATVSSATGDPVPGNNTATELTTVLAEADVEILKDGSVDVTNPSPLVTYDIDVINHGPSDALNVVFVDTLPLTPKKVVYTFDTGNGACVYDETAHTVTCDLGTVEAGESIEILIYVEIRGSVGVISNVVNVTTDTFDPDLDNNTARKDLLIHG
jgi:uncharacterized repeat protein (TIGR01451 family)